MAQPNSGLPVPPISNHPNFTIGDDKYPIEECVIEKEKGRVGMLIVGGRGTSCYPFGEEESGIFVSKLECGGAASNSNLHVGDRVLEVDGQNMTNATHEEAVKSLTKHTHSLNVKVRHEPAPHGLRDVTVKLGPGEKHGIHINHIRNSSEHERSYDGIFISKITESSPVAKESNLKVGQHIMEVNGQRLLGATRREAKHALRCVKETLEILVCDGLNKQMFGEIVSNKSSSSLGNNLQVRPDFVDDFETDSGDMEHKDMKRQPVNREGRTKSISSFETGNKDVDLKLKQKDLSKKMKQDTNEEESTHSVLEENKKNSGWPMAKKLYAQHNCYLTTQKTTELFTNECSQVDVALDNKNGIAASSVIPSCSLVNNTTSLVTDGMQNCDPGRTEILDSSNESPSSTKGFHVIKIPKGSQATGKSDRGTGDTPNKSKKGAHATHKPIQVTSNDDRTHADSKESQATDSHSVTGGTSNLNTESARVTDKLPPLKDGTPLSSEVEPENTDKLPPVQDGTPLSCTLEPQNTDKVHPSTDGTPLYSTVEPHNTDKPSLSTDGTPLYNTVEPEITEKSSPGTDGTPPSSTLEPQNTDKPSLSTDGTPLYNTVEPENTEKSSPGTDGTPPSSTLEPQNTDKLSLSTDGKPLSSTVQPENTEKSSPGTDGTPHSSTVEPQNTEKQSPATDGTSLSSTVQPQDTDTPPPVIDSTPLSSTGKPQKTDKPHPVIGGTPLSNTLAPQSTERSPLVTDNLRNSKTKGSQTTGELLHPSNDDLQNLSPEGARVTDKSQIPNNALLATDKKASSITVTEKTHVADKPIVAHNNTKRVGAKKTRDDHVCKVDNSKEAASKLMQMVCDPESRSIDLYRIILIVDYDNWTKVFHCLKIDDLNEIIVVLIYKQKIFKEPGEEAYKRIKENGHVLQFEAGVDKDATDCRILLTVNELFDRELPENVLVKVLSGDKIFLEMMADMKEYVDTGQLDLVSPHDSVLANYDQITKLEPRDDRLKLAFINIPTSADKNEPVIGEKSMEIKSDDSLLKYMSGRINGDQLVQPVAAYRIPQKRKCPESTNILPGIVIVGFESEDSTLVLRNRPILQGAEDHHKHVSIRPIQSWYKRLTTRYIPVENNGIGVIGVEKNADNQTDIGSGTDRAKSNKTRNGGINDNAVETHDDSRGNSTQRNQGRCRRGGKQSNVGRGRRRFGRWGPGQYSDRGNRF